MRAFNHLYNPSIVEIYKGYTIEHQHISFCCRTLRLYGYANLSNLKRAITRQSNKSCGMNDTAMMKRR